MHTFDDSPPTDVFAGRQHDYASHRPSYPRAAMAAIVDGLGPRARVIDVVCGTGISSRLLADAGADVIGIDPSEAMLAEARAAVPGQLIEYRRGTAEATGLADESVDAVVCAQSFHWFDAPAALREFHRVLRVDGRLALMWNVRQPDDPFMVAYERIMTQAQSDTERRGRPVRRERSGDPQTGGFFRICASMEFSNPRHLDLEGVLGRARSASYFPTHEPLRSELEHALREAFERHARDGHIVMRQTAQLTLARRI